MNALNGFTEAREGSAGFLDLTLMGKAYYHDSLPRRRRQQEIAFC